MSYLYGVSVQGIQEYIFATNKLKEIVGASEIVKKIDNHISKYQNDPKKILVRAGGNIKAVFDNEEDIKKVVREFEKEILEMAYGVTISQAVEKFDGEYPDSEVFNTLEKKLKIQRNKKKLDLDLGLNIFKLAPTTSKPAVEFAKVQKKTIPIDKATKQKRDANNKDEEYNDISKLANQNNKIAIIHADGNGLGKLVPTLKKKLSAFSENLDKATNRAFERAQEEGMKIRKVILGGDDMTVICDADIALDFTRNYLKYFEEETGKIQEIDGYLTACAGITYCNKKYPFHYAVALAEELCSYAKDKSNRESSCLMFHAIQSSNVDDYDKFIEDELTITNDETTIQLNYGPYYIDPVKGASLDKFIILAKSLDDKNSPSSSLRDWLSQLYFNNQYAENMIQRIDEMADLNKMFKKEILNKNFQNLHPDLSLKTPIVDSKTPIYDLLQILSVQGGK